MCRAAVMLLVLGLLAAGALASAGGSPAASPSFRATLTAPNHHPKADRPWPPTFTATYKGRPVRAHLQYEFLYGGRVVSRQNPGPLQRSGYRFTGRFTDREFVWPARAAGVRLTLRAVISSRYGTRRPTWWVVVRR